MKQLAMKNDFCFKRPRIEWLKDGDRNCAYFHRIIKSRIHKSRITSKCDEKKKKDLKVKVWLLNLWNVSRNSWEVIE